MTQSKQETFVADDYPIAQVPDIPLWSENYAFTCNDAASGVSFVAFLGRWWADPSLWREVVAIALPGERMLCIKNYGRAATAEVASASVFRVEVVKPGQTLRLTYDGPAFEQSRAELLKYGFQPGAVNRCKFDVVFDGVSPVWNMSGHASKSTEIAGALHVEQIGRGDGHIEFGTERFEINNAFTNRDHSRGVRNVETFKRHCWAQGHFAEEGITFSVYAMEMYGVDGPAMCNASVTKGGRRYPAEVKEIEMIEGRADGCRPYCIVISSELGEMVLNKAVTLGSAPISMVNPWDLHHGAVYGIPSGLTFEEAVIWEWEGKQGHGWSERCFVHEPFYGLNS